MHIMLASQDIGNRYRILFAYREIRNAMLT